MMPAYNFQTQFVPMIEDESKWHTVRKRRKRPTKPGDKLMLYTGQRTKKCKLVKETVCTKVLPIKIYPHLVRIVLDGKRLSLQEVVHFSMRDGFTNPLEFFDFFKRYTVMEREFELEVIYWRDDEA